MSHCGGTLCGLADKLSVMRGIWFLFVFGQAYSASNMDYLDIGLEYSQVSKAYFWTNPVVVQLIYEIPELPSMDEFTKPRCEYAQNARRSLYYRFKRQFPDLTQFKRYQASCDRFEDKKNFVTDDESHCETCFKISSDNDPFYLECLTLLELKHLCNGRQKRDTDTKEHYILSSIAVKLAEGAKTQDDRITSKFRQDHGLQKENVNFQLLFLNTFRWQLSMSELWFLHYVQSDPDLYAKILVHMSGILPETRAMTEKKINSSLSADWLVQSSERNGSHVTINVSFTSFHPEYQAQLYRFRFLPVKYKDFYFALNLEDTFALKCGDIAVQLTTFAFHQVEENEYLPDSPCHQNHVTSNLQLCMKNVLNGAPNAREMCMKNAKELMKVNEFYFSIENDIWMPNSITLNYNCASGDSARDKIIENNSLMRPECGCYYSTAQQAIPKTKTCSARHSFTRIRSNFTLKQISSAPFFIGKSSESTNGSWKPSAANKLTEQALLDSEKVKQYFKTKMEEEASASFGWDFKLGFSSVWLILPAIAIILLFGVVCFKCKSGSGFGGSFPRPMFITYCQHGEAENVNLRTDRSEASNTRVVSWPARRKDMEEL